MNTEQLAAIEELKEIYSPGVDVIPMVMDKNCLRKTLASFDTAYTFRRDKI